MHFHAYSSGRLVDCTSLKRAIEFVYSATLPQASKPFIYMSITLPSEHVDVNIHPTKKEVHFETSFYDLFYFWYSSILLSIFLLDKKWLDTFVILGFRLASWIKSVLSKLLKILLRKSWGVLIPQGYSKLRWLIVNLALLYLHWCLSNCPKNIYIFIYLYYLCLYCMFIVNIDIMWCLWVITYPVYHISIWWVLIAYLGTIVHISFLRNMTCQLPPGDPCL